MSAPVSVFRIRICYFKLHLTVFCVRYLIFLPYLVRLYTKLLKNHVRMMFSPSVSVIKRVKFLPIHVRTWVDGRGYTDTDRCSLPYASEWFASINRYGYTDMDKCSLALIPCQMFLYWVVPFLPFCATDDWQPVIKVPMFLSEKLAIFDNFCHQSLAFKHVGKLSTSPPAILASFCVLITVSNLQPVTRALQV